jgi:quinol monooxygenase YgiN
MAAGLVEPRMQQSRGQAMDTTIRVDSAITTLINIFTVEPENRPKLVELLKGSTETMMSKMPGWISTSFLDSKDGRRVIIYSQWRSAKDIETMRQNPEMGPYLQKVIALAKFEAVTGDVTYARHA